MTANMNFMDLANAGVRSLQPYQPGKPLGELEREFGISEAIKLASNENPLGPSPVALERLAQESAGLHRYPDGNGFVLKTALAVRHDVDPARITLGNGSNDVLELIARAFLAPGLNAVFSEHAFAVYPIATQAVGAEARIARANRADHAMPFGHDLTALAAAVDDRTRVVFIANPNNPTGTWLDAAELEAFLRELPATVIAVVDEAYFDYVGESAYPDTSQWLERFPRLVVTRTFSKIYGLAALRIGYGLSHPQVADLLNRVRQPFNVNALAQAAALGALEDAAHVQHSVQVNRDGMRQLEHAFTDLGLAWIPSVANFVCVEVGDDAAGVYQALLRRGVIVRPVANYQLPRHLRVTVGTSDENQQVIAALGEAVG
jgi:histidinol-phosphate aminotransferase